MFHNGQEELARLRQADLIREARHRALVREAGSVRTNRPRHLLAVALHAAAHRMEPRVTTRAAGNLPCAISPC